MKNKKTTYTINENENIMESLENIVSEIMENGNPALILFQKNNNIYIKYKKVFPNKYIFVVGTKANSRIFQLKFIDAFWDIEDDEEDVENKKELYKKIAKKILKKIDMY